MQHDQPDTPGHQRMTALGLPIPVLPIRHQNQIRCSALRIQGLGTIQLDHLVTQGAPGIQSPRRNRDSPNQDMQGRVLC